MARRYDSRTTIFSPEGRLYQVEYAMEAISHAGTCIGITCPEGIILAAEKKVTSKLLEQGSSTEKIYIVHDKMLCAVAGIASDANNLINYARTTAQRHLFTYNSDMPAEQLVQRLCDLKQGYTQYGGLRPFGVSFLYAGYDDHFGFQLYHSDPSGNYSGWKATCIGANNGAATSMLKSEYKEEGEEGAEQVLTLDGISELAIKVLAKSVEATSLTSEKRAFLFIAIMRKVGDQVKFSILKASEIDALLAKHNPATDDKKKASE
ncbi:nucleophile aminohydrolase [Blastocladiella britannica]|nr:nucleophile aminohydrolase [Blastocladiella britannica]